MNPNEEGEVGEWVSVTQWDRQRRPPVTGLRLVTAGLVEAERRGRAIWARREDLDVAMPPTASAYVPRLMPGCEQTSLSRGPTQTNKTRRTPQ